MNQQPTNQRRTNQATRKPTANQPTSQVPVHTGGGGFHKLGRGGAKHTTNEHSAVHNPAMGGGAREEGGWEGGTCTLGNPMAQTHMAGRREGVTHLPLCVTVHPLLQPNQKNQHTCKEEKDTLPNHKQNNRGPTTHTTTWKGGAGANGSTLRGCLCGACVWPLTHPPHP